MNMNKKRRPGGNHKTLETGDGLATLRQEMAEIRPGFLGEISISNFLKSFGCVRCGDIPDPDNLMACDEGHYTCVGCAFRGNKGNGSGNGSDQNWNVESCCDIGKLHKELPHMLKLMLDNVLFRCLNHGKGCEEKLLGQVKFHEHILNCPFTTFYKCRFHQCAEKRFSVERLLRHYTDDHGASILTLAKTSIVLPIEFKATMEHRRCAILKVNGKHFVFAAEVKHDFVFIWIWALENGAAGLGKSTNIWYHLRFREVRKLPEEKTEELQRYTAKCVLHSVDPSEMTITNGTLVDKWKLDVQTFKKMFVEQTVDGNGKWSVIVSLKEPGVKPSLKEA